jgi:hypothetical protein
MQNEIGFPSQEEEIFAFYQNTGKHLQDYMASQPKVTPQRKPQI